MNVIEYLTDNSGILGLVVGILSLVVGILGILFAVYTWVKGKHKREFTYAKTTFQLVREGASTIKGLEILYGNKPISDISVTRFTIWNSGTGKITDQDVYSKLPPQPLCIKSTENAQILDYSIIQPSKTNKFEAKMEDKNLTMHFECVEKEDGVVIQVLHTGNADELNPTIGIKGNEKRGMQTYRMKAMIDLDSKKQNKMRVLAYLFIACVCVLGFLFSQYEQRSYKPNITTGLSAAEINSFGSKTVTSTAGGNGIAPRIGINPDPEMSELFNDYLNYYLDDYIKKYDLYYNISIACVVILLFSILRIVFIIRKEYNISIPQKLRDYVKVEITS